MKKQKLTTDFQPLSNSAPKTERRNLNGYIINRLAIFVMITAVISGLALPFPFFTDETPKAVNNIITPRASANSVYHNLSGGAFTFTLNASNTNLITQNDNWSNVPSMEGYTGSGLTNTEGVNPQTILGAEFANNQLPSSANTQINANKGNPDAYNSAGITEFDTGTYIALGMQGKIQAESPYIVFYLNTSGRTNVTFSYNLIDIDGGSNNSVSPVALQYRVGETGLFTNIPAGFVADATDGGVAGRVTPVSVALPSNAWNQPNVQVRIITNDPPGQAEWIGINNIAVSSLVPTAANASISGRVFADSGAPLSRANVMLYDPYGNVRSVQTNSFGYYEFSELPVGETYFVEARSKRFTFSNPTQVVTLYDNLQDINFYAGTIEYSRAKNPQRKE